MPRTPSEGNGVSACTATRGINIYSKKNVQKSRYQLNTPAPTASILLYEENIITVRRITRGRNGLSGGRAASGRGRSRGPGVCRTAERLRRSATGVRTRASGGRSASGNPIRILGRPLLPPVPSVWVSPVLWI